MIEIKPFARGEGSSQLQTAVYVDGVYFGWVDVRSDGRVESNFLIPTADTVMWTRQLVGDKGRIGWDWAHRVQYCKALHGEVERGQLNKYQPLQTNDPEKAMAHLLVVAKEFQKILRQSNGVYA